jgi:predicted ribonuclease YlaK
LARREKGELIMKYVIDTNILLVNANVVNEYEEVILPIHVLEEMDGLKKAEGELGYKARKAIHALENATNITYDTLDFFNDSDIPGFDTCKRDNQIILCAKKYDATLLSNDICVVVKARALSVKVEKYKKKEYKKYSGFLEVEMSHEELSDFYYKQSTNFTLLTNQYLIIKNNEQIVDILVNAPGGLRNLQYKPIQSSNLGKFSPYDVYQKAAVDSLYNNKMTMLRGKAGTGKSLIAISYALAQLEKGKYETLIIFTNPVATRGSAQLGYYPGTRDEKLLDSQIGNMLSAKLGDKMEVERFIKNGRLVLLPMSDLRGFDTTSMKAIVYITEAQNLDIELMRLAIQRVGEDSKLIIDGDYTSQVDSHLYEGDKNGMRRVSEIFRGHECYGEIELMKIYRSEIAEIADRM